MKNAEVKEKFYQKYLVTRSYGTLSNEDKSSLDDGERVGDEAPRPKGWGTRHTFSILAFLSLLINFSLRANISVAIVAMVGTGSDDNGTLNIGTECPIPDEFLPQVSNETEEDTPNRGEFNWSPEEQGIILGAYYYGFIVTQIPGGIISEKFGGKWMMGIMTSMAGILTLFNPLAARNGGIGALTALRVIQGLIQGLLIPSTFSMIARWVPKTERSQLFNVIWAGHPFSTVITMPLSGLLADSLGWPSVYYFFGSVALAFGVLWTLLAHDSPSSHPFISEAERKYIVSNLQASPTGPNKGRLPFPPWKQILKSIPVWALTFSFTGSSWGFYMMLTEIPTYLNSIQHMPLTSNGFFSALPYLLMIFFSIPSAWLADGLVRKEIASRGKIRKIFTIVGLFGPALCFIGLSFSGCNPALAVVWLCLAVMLAGANNSGMNINQMELTPNYAGTLRGFTNMIGNTSGILAPYFAGAMTENNQTLAGWRNIFLTTSGIQILSVLVFVVFGRTSVQSWNTYWLEDTEEETEQQKNGLKAETLSEK